jgi:hypothetical protein
LRSVFAAGAIFAVGAGLNEPSSIRALPLRSARIWL